jgi:hypothetical protein
MPVEVVTTYDMPYLCGYSTDGKKRFVDRHFHAPGQPIGTIEVDGKMVNVLPFLVGDHRKRWDRPHKPLGWAGHEGVEYAAMAVWGWSYSPAHVLATGAERRLATVSGIRWDPLVKAYKPYIKAAEHERLERMPPDFDLRPILAKPVDKRLVSAVREAMGSDKGKMEKQDKTLVHYDDRRGRPSHHCGVDHEWKEHSCQYWKDPLGCELVRGIIAVRGGCDLWEDIATPKST